MVSLSDFTEILSAAKKKNGQPYSRKSIRDITGNIAKFMKALKFLDVSLMLSKPQQLAEHLLTSKDYSDNSLKTYFANAFTATRVLGLPTDVLQAYQSRFEAYREKVKETSLEAEPPKNAVLDDKLIPWPTIVNWTHEGESNPRTRAVHALYTLIPPRREEFRDVLVYEKVSKDSGTSIDKSKEHAFDTNGVAWNYLDLSKGVLVLRDYKTSDRYGVYRKVLPPKLLEILKSYISSRSLPAFLFPGQDGVSPMSQQGFSDLVKRSFALGPNQNLGVRELRICRISYAIDVEHMEKRELKELADAMAHSLTTQQEYRRKGLLKTSEIRKGLPADKTEAITMLLAIIDSLKAKISALEMFGK